MTNPTFWHEFFTWALIYLSAKEVFSIGRFLTNKFGLLKTAKFTFAVPKAAASVKSATDPASQTKAEKPVCWRVFLEETQSQSGISETTLIIQSRRGTIQVSWAKGDATQLEALEIGIKRVFPHFQAGDRVVIVVGQEDQLAFNLKADEPHDNIVAERILKFFKAHHEGDVRFENFTRAPLRTAAPAVTPAVTSVPAAQAPKASAPQPPKPATTNNTKAPIAAPAASSLPLSSPAFDDSLDAAANF